MIEFLNKPQLLRVNDVQGWLSDCAFGSNIIITRLLFIFVDNKKIQELNKKFLSHDRPTDIITFPYDTKQGIEAEVFISLEMAKKNAKEYSQTLENELLRLISHGFLHLLGYTDATSDSRKIMSNKENQMIELFHVKHKSSSNV